MDGYKCNSCFHIIPAGEMIDGACPLCGETKLVKKMCKEDSGVCKCAHDTHSEVKLCDICNEPICPECGSHDVVGVSRVTGYLSDVSGWRNSKRAELRERQRYDVGFK